jgi:hypothetical protein
MVIVLFMARDTVLVLGAGASYGARSTALRPPPIGKDLAGYLLRWFNANAPRDDDPLWSNAMYDPQDYVAPSKDPFRGDPDVRPVLVRAAQLSKTSDTAFEEVMYDLLRDEDRRLLEKVNEVVCYALLGGRESAFDAGQDLFDKFFAVLRPTLRAIITPNYDLLSEEALERVGLTYRYRVLERDKAGADVVLDKFHGSANWFSPSGAGRGTTIEAAQRSARPLKAVKQAHVLSYYNDHGVFPSIGNRRWNAVLELKHGHASPVLVTYGPGKDALYGRPHLDTVRKECAAELVQNPPRRVIAFGIRPPRDLGDDDAWEAICAVFRTVGSAKEYWSKNEEERQRMAAYGFVGRHGYFDELLASL